MTWKKIRDEKGPYDTPYILWENKRNNDRVSVWGLTNGKKDPKKRSVKSNIAVVYKVRNKRYSTKTKAMSVARNYMARNK